MYETFLYLGGLFNMVLYVSDFYATYQSYKALYDPVLVQENRTVNVYALSMRLCMGAIDASYFAYYQCNGVEAGTTSFALYCVGDATLMTLRGYFLYILYRRMECGSIRSELDQEPVVNPMVA